MLLREMDNRALPDEFIRDRGHVNVGFVLARGAPAQDTLLHQPAEHGPDRGVGNALAQALLDIFRRAAAELIDQQRDLSLRRGEVQHNLRGSVHPHTLIDAMAHLGHPR